MRYLILLFLMQVQTGAAQEMVRLSLPKGFLWENEVSLKKLSAKWETVHRGPQMFGPAKVSDTWFQLVKAPNGERTYVAGEYYQNLPQELLPKLKEMASNAESATRSLVASDPSLRVAYKVYPAKLEVFLNQGKFVPYWYITYVGQKQNGFFYIKADEQLKVFARGTTGVNDLDGAARVYPQGPLSSSITDEILPGFNGDGTLTGNLLKVDSALNIRVFSPDSHFLFPPEDPRFPQVQVYYFVNKALLWFQTEFGAILPQALQVQVQIGTDGVSNAAFYHDYNIYLGSGDGLTYKDMLKDPTVVVHEAGHALVDAYTGLPTEGEGGSINEGFADLFACLFLDTPNVGAVSYVPGPYRRTIKSDLKVQDFNRGLYHDGDILAATFWELRERFGRETTAHIAFRTLVRLGAGSKFKDLLPALSAALETELHGQDLQTAMGIVTKRGWTTEIP